METIYIYGLFDPRNNELRYVGKTINLELRLKDHISEAKNYCGHNLYKERWIRGLLEIKMMPIIKIISECNQDNWQMEERKQIALGRKEGKRLTNLAEGGMGAGSGVFSPMFGRTHTKEAREKISQKNKGKHAGEKHPFYGGGDKFSLNHRKNMSIAAKNKPPITEETRIKMKQRPQCYMGPNRGRKLSEEWKRKVGEAFKNKPKSDNHNKKNSLAVTMMWAQRQGNIQKIVETQKEYFNLFGEYNQKYIEYI